jgi:hypothetical protein
VVEKSMSSVDLFRVAQLIYPIMLAQEAGEISEAKAAELIGLDVATYRERKHQAIAAVMGMLAELPSPLILLLEGTKGLPKSLTKSG